MDPILYIHHYSAGSQICVLELYR